MSVQLKLANDARVVFENQSFKGGEGSEHGGRQGSTCGGPGGASSASCGEVDGGDVVPSLSACHPEPLGALVSVCVHPGGRGSASSGFEDVPERAQGSALRGSQGGLDHWGTHHGDGARGSNDDNLPEECGAATTQGSTKQHWQRRREKQAQEQARGHVHTPGADPLAAGGHFSAEVRTWAMRIG
jgi:hypothetical protein